MQPHSHRHGRSCRNPATASADALSHSAGVFPDKGNGTGTVLLRTGPSGAWGAGHWPTVYRISAPDSTAHAGTVYTLVPTPDSFQDTVLRDGCGV